MVLLVVGKRVLSYVNYYDCALYVETTHSNNIKCLFTIVIQTEIGISFKTIYIDIKQCYTKVCL